MTAEPAAAPAAPPSPPQELRYLVVLGVVGVWMVLGKELHLGPYPYLLLGVPLLVVFQRFVARRPLSELWVRPAVARPFPLWGYLVAGAAMVVPVLALARAWALTGWTLRLYFLGTVLGAIPLAFAITRFTRQTLKSLLLCLATGGVLGVGYMLVFSLLSGRFAVPSLARLAFGGQQFLLLLPVCFVVEEVFFRGGLDSYLHRPGDRLPWLSAIFISVLWGLWHLPLTPAPSLFVMFLRAGLLILVHCLAGVPFSLYWRRSGNLIVPAAVHALIDAVRNMLFF